MEIIHHFPFWPSHLRFGVMVSFAGHGRSRMRSFPRRRESTAQTIGNATTTKWIPAFAGMTSVSKGIAFQMTPLSGSVTPLVSNQALPSAVPFQRRPCRRSFRTSRFNPCPRLPGTSSSSLGKYYL